MYAFFISHNHFRCFYLLIFLVTRMACAYVCTHDKHARVLNHSFARAKKKKKKYSNIITAISSTTITVRRRRCPVPFLALKNIINYISVNGRWKYQVGSKEQQTSHIQRFLVLFLLFFLMVHARGRCYSLSLSLALSHSSSLLATSKSQHVTYT